MRTPNVHDKKKRKGRCKLREENGIGRECKEERGRERFGEGYQREEEKDCKEGQTRKRKITE
jgi:hypothetical protein